MKISRQAYADMYGATIGDKVRLGDTELFITPEKDFTVYSIDLPGHGEATLDDHEEYDPRSLGEMILNYMQIVHNVPKMHVAGNSLGGWITLEMAALEPNRISSVTALAPAGLWVEAPTMKIPPSIDSRILAKISQFFMPLAFHIPPLKALGYRKITHLWRELSLYHQIAV